MANKFLLKRGSGAPSSIDEYELVYDYTNNLLYTKVGATITAISGSGGSSDISVANQANNRLITATGTTDSLNGESNLTFDGSTLTVNGDIRINDSAAGGLEVGTSQDLQIYHNGTNSFGADNYTGHLIFQQRADDQDIIFKNDDGVGGVTAYLTLDGSAGYTTVQKLIKFEDSVDARFGTGSDLRIRHDGTNSKIDNYTGNLKIRNTLDDADITLETDNGSGGVTPYLTLDGSATNVIIHKQFCFQDTTAVINRVSNDLEIRTYGGYDINLMAAGNVGIGTSSPVTKLHIQDNYDPDDSLGYLHIENTNTTSGSVATNSALTVKNYHGTSQFMQWEEHGLRIGSRILTNSGSGHLVFTAGADSEKMRIQAGGNVGIGTASPNALLHLYSTSNTQLRLQTTGTGNGSNVTYQNGSASYTVGINSAEQFSFYSSQLGSDAGFINTNGNLYWNHNILLSVNHKFLYSRDTNGTLTRMFGMNSGNTTYIGPIDSYAGGSIVYGISSNVVDQVFYTSGSERLRIKATTGNVGIGTSSPGSTLHISKETSTSASSTGTTLFTLTNDVGADLNQQKTFVDFTLLDDNANETPQVRIGAEVGQNGDANTQEKEGSGAFVVYTNNADTTSGDAGASLAERMRVDYQGNVGIGTTSPGHKLQVSGGDIAIDVGERMYFGGGNHTYISEDIDDRLRFFTGGDEFMRFTQQDGATELFHIYQDVYLPDDKKIHFGAGNDIKIYHNAGGNSNFENHSGDLYFTQYTDDGDIFFRTDNGSGGVANYIQIDGGSEYVYFHKDIALKAAEKLYLDGGGNTYIDEVSSGQLRLVADGTEVLKGYGSGAIDMYGGSTTSRSINIGANRSGNGYSFIDLIGDATYSDFGARFIRENTGPNTGTAIEHRGTGVLSLNAKDAGSVRFYTNNTERVRIDSSGNMSLGNVAPSAKLHVAGSAIFDTDTGNDPFWITRLGNTNESLRIYVDDSSAVFQTYQDETSGDRGNFIFVMDSDSTAYTDFRHGSATKMRIKSNGNVGIGELSPDRKLHITGSENELMCLESTDNNADLIFADTGGSVRVRGASGNFDVYTGGTASNTSASGSTYAFRIESDGDFRLRTPEDRRVYIGDGNEFSIRHSSAGYNLFDSANGAFYIRNTISNQNIYFGINDGGTTVYPMTVHGSSSNIGIGTTSPAQKLHISGGNARIDGDIITQPTNKFYLDGGNDTYIYEAGANVIDFVTAGSRTMQMANTYAYTEDNVLLGVGGDVNFYMKHDGTNSLLQNSTGDLTIKTTASNEDMIFSVNDGGSQINAIYIDSSNNGMVKLQNDLQYLTFGSGDDGVLYSYEDNFYIANFTAGKDTIFQNLNSDSSSYVEIMRLDGSTSRVGIGTSSPLSKLHVKDATNISMNASGNGQMRVEGSGYTLGIALNGSGAFIYHNSSSRFLSFGTNETEQVRLTTGGALHVVNDVVAFSTTPSDKKLKTNVKDIDYGLGTIMKLNPKQYDWKEDNRHDIGFIAQEVEEVIPEIVKDNEWFDKKIKTLDYEKLTAVLIKAVQEQQEQINELKEKLNG